MKLLLKRIIAHIIDVIILGIIGAFWVVLLIALKRMNLLSVEAVKILYTIGFIIIGVLYFLQEGPLGKGQTIGKKALKIKVISVDGGVPSYKQAIIRNLLRVWDGIFFYAIGISRIYRSEKGQRFGDKVAKTTVVEDSRGLPKIWILIILAVIIVSGVLVWWQLQVPVKEVGAPQDEIWPLADETANWKTYRNEEYGFEVRYPNDWEVELIGERVIFTSPGVLECRAKGGKECGLSSPQIEIFNSVAELPNNEENFTFEEWFEQGQKDRIFGDKKHVKIGDYEGVDVVESGMIGYRTVFLLQSSKIARLSVGDSPNLTVIFNQILSTFRFLEEEEVKPQAERSNGRPPLEILKNMEYQLFECPTGGPIDDNDAEYRFLYLYNKAICKVKIENGDYDFCEKASEVCSELWGSYVHGFDADFSGATFTDLNNDNIDDALVTLRVSYGGVGNTAYLAAVIIAGDEYRNVDTITIPGDRAGVEITSINNGIITIYSPLHYELYANVLKISFSEEKGFEIIERKTVPQG